MYLEDGYGYKRASDILGIPQMTSPALKQGCIF
jgi:hypothetical protein